MAQSITPSPESLLLASVEDVVGAALAAKKQYPEADAALQAVLQRVDQLLQVARQGDFPRSEAAASQLGSWVASLEKSPCEPAAFAEKLEGLLESLNSEAEEEISLSLARERIASGGSLAIFEDAANLGEFVNETASHLTSIEEQLLILEQHPQETEPVHALFRGFHTIKGLAGIYNLAAVRDLAHEVESILDLVRNANLSVTPTLIDTVLACADWLTECNSLLAQAVQTSSQANQIGWPPCDVLLERLREELLRPENEEAGELAAETGAGAFEWAERGEGLRPAPMAIPMAIPMAMAGENQASATTGESGDGKAAGSPAQATAGNGQMVGEQTGAGAKSNGAGARPTVAGAKPSGASARQESIAQANAALAASKQVEQLGSMIKRELSSGGQVKVDTLKLDALVDMVGELMIAQSLVRQDPAVEQFRDLRFQRNLSHLSRITSDLQKVAMSLRVIPVRQTFLRMQRAFRDLVKKSGKEAQLILSGEEAELDRTIVEELADPLLHMMRNAVDHGLETADEREAKGKPRGGTVRLSASHHSGSILIELSDDGRGLNLDKILKKATERGLVRPNASLSPNEIIELIFEPGFSTADQVSDVSGRGVGMDVVRKQIQKLRGRVDIRSEAGQGTSFQIRLPLTLAIIDGLLVRLADQRFILPLSFVQEIVQPNLEAIRRIEGRREIMLLRDQAIPYLRLDEMLQLSRGTRLQLAKEEESLQDAGQPAGRANEAARVGKVLIVVEVEGRRYALAVDDLLGKQEVVIKNLGDWLGNTPGVCGGAILGDGTVGLILDLEALLHLETSEHAA